MFDVNYMNFNIKSLLRSRQLLFFFMYRLQDLQKLLDQMRQEKADTQSAEAFGT